MIKNNLIIGNKTKIGIGIALAKNLKKNSSVFAIRQGILNLIKKWYEKF